MKIGRREFLKTICAGTLLPLSSKRKAYASSNQPIPSELFEQEKGSMVLRSIRKLSEKGFVVATTDVYDKVLIVDKTTSKARTFRLEGEYLDLLVLSTQIRAIRNLSYTDIKKYL